MPSSAGGARLRASVMLVRLIPGVALRRGPYGLRFAAVNERITEGAIELVAHPEIRVVLVFSVNLR